MIKQETVDTVKQTTDIVSLVESKGVQLKKNGRGYLGKCPFHDDKTPSLSVNPKENLWQCFGCGVGGDAIRFIEMMDNVDFPEAVSRLTHSRLPKNNTKEKPTNHKPGLTVKEKKLLARVLSYYQHTFTEDTKALAYLKERGIQDHQSITDFGAGYANGTLLDILPEDDQVIQSLKDIGILNAKGKEVFYNCVIFPLLDQDGSSVCLYGRNISDNAKIPHLYLKGPRSGIINRQAVKRSQTIILTESIIDALTLYDQGFKNVIPVYGVNGLTGDHLFLFNSIKEV